MTQTQKAQPRHPDWPIADEKKFEEHYDLLGSVRYPLYDQRPVKKFLGPTPPAACAICERSLPAVTFKKDAHALPAALGNRRLLSLEECDDCNEKFSAWEDDLVNMLAVQRVMGRVPARKGYPKFSPQGASSIIAASPSDLRIFRDEKDNSVALDFQGEGEASLTLSCPAYSPVRAALALLRSLWVILSPDARAQAPWILASVKQGRLDGCQLFRLTTVGSPSSSASLSGWRKKSTAIGLKGAEVVLQFHFFDTTLIVLGPDEGGTASATLLPPFPITHGSVRSVEYRLKTADDRVEAGTTTYHLEFDHHFKGAEGPPPPPPPRQDGRDVLIETGHGESARRIRTKLHFDSWEENDRRLRLEGVQWPGKMDLVLGPEGAVGTFTLQVFVHSMAARDALPAADFMEELRQSRSIRIILAETEQTVFESKLGPENIPNVCDGPILRDLALIHDKLGLDIRVPKNVTVEFQNALQLAAAVLRTGRLERRGGTVSVTLERQQALQLIEFSRIAEQTGEEHTIQLQGTNTVILEGHEIPLGPCTETCWIDDVIDDGGSATQAKENKEYLTVRLRFSKSTTTFERWFPRSGI